MNKLQKVELKKILPSNLKNDATVLALCESIDSKLHEIEAATDIVLLLPNIETLPDWLLDELAWQYHVDYYNNNAPVATKRSLIKQAIALHKYKGTPLAVEEVCTTIFQTAKVAENWEYDGEPYHFKVTGIQEAVPNTSVMEKLKKTIYEVKNVRSSLDEINFYRQSEGSIYIGGAILQHKYVEIKMGGNN